MSINARGKGNKKETIRNWGLQMRRYLLPKAI